MALNFRPYDDAAGRETRNRWAQSLDGIFEAYNQAKQNAQGQPLRDAQLQAAQQQIAQGQRQAAGADLQETAQFGAPVASYGQQGLQQGAIQSQPGFTGPVNPKYARLVEGLQAIQAKSKMAAQEQQLGMDKTRSEIRENEAQADAMGRDQIYVDPASGKQITVPKGAKLLPADSKKDGRILPANSVLALNEGKAVARILPEVEDAIKQNESMFGPIGGRVSSANPYDEKSQTVDARMRTASQAFGRFMEGGVLRKEDEDKYRKMFPQLSDIPQVAKNKLSIVRRQLAQKYEDDRKALGGSGYDIGGFGTLDIPKSLFENGTGGAIALTGAKAARLAELRAKRGR